MKRLYQLADLYLEKTGQPETQPDKKVITAFLKFVFEHKDDEI